MENSGVIDDLALEKTAVFKGEIPQDRVAKAVDGVDGGRIEGILTQKNLLKALSASDRHPTITTAMQQNFVTVDSLDMLENAFAKLKECKLF